MVEQNPMALEPDVVMTGAGLACCLGLDRDTAWRGVVEGRSGIGPLTAIESPLLPGMDGGQAPDLPNASEDEPREIGYLRLAMKQALREASSPGPLPYAASRCGIVVGTTLHGMRSGGRFLRTGDPAALCTFLSGNVLQSAAAGLGLEGFATTVCSACSSGLASIALAATLLRSGLLDLVLAGGYDPISEYAYGGFNSMRLVTEGRIRPFARDRAGMKLGEGYGIVVLERAADALHRHATPLARIAGFGEACDAYHLSKPHPEGAGAARAIQKALTMACVAPREIGMIAAHATATPDNDAAEFKALSRVFLGDLASVPVVAFKSRLGHTLGGAGAVELILSAAALREKVVPPCANVRAEDVEFKGLHLATDEARRAPLRFVLNTSLGFGGSNISMVLGSPRTPQIAECVSASDQDREVWITGVGVVLPGAVGNEEFMSLLRRREDETGTQDTGGLVRLNVDHLLNARRVRRMSDYVKLTLAATTLAYQDAHVEDVEEFGETCSGILGTTHGSTCFCERYYQQIIDEGLAAANPLLFAEGVPNAGSAHLSTTMSIQGLCQTVIGTRTAGLDALILASHRLRSGVWTRAVVCAADEYAPVINRAYAHFGLYRSSPSPGANGKCAGFATGCGAVALVVERADAARGRNASPRGIVRETAGAFVPSLPTRRGVAAVQRVIAELGHPNHLVCSANATWLDRVELAGVIAADRSERREHRQRSVVAAIYGHATECFSANPMAGLASVLISGGLPPWRAGWSGKNRVATGEERTDSFGVLATDYSGTVSGLRIHEVRPRPTR